MRPNIIAGPVLLMVKPDTDPAISRKARSVLGMSGLGATRSASVVPLDSAIAVLSDGAPSTSTLATDFGGLAFAVHFGVMGDA